MACRGCPTYVGQSSSTNRIALCENQRKRREDSGKFQIMHVHGASVGNVAKGLMDSRSFQKMRVNGAL